MVRINPRRFLKTSTIDDHYWRYSWFLMEGLEHALEHDSDSEVLRALKNPNLFTGRS